MDDAKVAADSARQAAQHDQVKSRVDGRVNAEIGSEIVARSTETSARVAMESLDAFLALHATERLPRHTHGSPFCRIWATVSGSQREAHGAARATLEGPVHRARIAHEVCPRPRMPSKELDREQVPLERVTSPAGGHQVARHVGAAMRERVDVVQRGGLQLQGLRAVDAAAAAVAHGGALDGALLAAGQLVPVNPADVTMGPWHGDAMRAAASGHVHLTGKGKPPAPARCRRAGGRRVNLRNGDD